MSYHLTPAGCSALHAASDAAARPAMPPVAPRSSQYFLHAVYQHADAAKPAYLDVVRATDIDTKRALLAAHGSSFTPAAAAAASDAAHRQTRSVLLVPHMDDIDEEIQALGYEKAMVAGATAGVIEHVFMFPVDTIKTRMQALQTGPTPNENRTELNSLSACRPTARGLDTAQGGEEEEKELRCSRRLRMRMHSRLMPCRWSALQERRGRSCAGPSARRPAARAP